jgi:hypothetical protein
MTRAVERAAKSFASEIISRVYNTGYGNELPDVLDMIAKRLAEHADEVRKQRGQTSKQ